MKINIFVLTACFFSLLGTAFAADPIVLVRPAMFSTSTDWEAVTGLRLRQYWITFGRDSAAGNIGTELYYLDQFPCYGQSDRARAWISPSKGFAWDTDRVARMNITCLYAPKVLNFAWRTAEAEAYQAVTKGILTCAVDDKSTDIKIRLAECEQGPEWKDL